MAANNHRVIDEVFGADEILASQRVRSSECKRISLVERS
jgi:hypothetical protein